ncbi:MAG: response regulator transcription factor [Clostridiales bacterium]|nr:response regulator transcription factor [Clostridiales bacterium]
MYNVAIYDDNYIIQERVIEILKAEFGDSFNYITAAKPADLIASAAIIDILIIDINFGNAKKLNGIDIASRIKTNNRDCQVIFISGYMEYAQMIFDAKPIFFVQKPIEDGVLIKAVGIGLDNLSRSRSQRFCYQKESKIYIVPIEDIVYFESSKRVVKIVTNEGPDSFYDTLNAIQERIAGEFIRIHQSYLVNTRYIAKMTGSEIILNDGRKLQISKPRMASVREELIRLFSEKM